MTDIPSSPIEFIETVLHDPETGKPFVLLPAERDFLAHAFALDPDGRLLYPEQVFGAPKKSGKTGFAALHMLTTILLFGGAFAEGYALANDQEQALGRVFQAMRRIVEASPLLRQRGQVRGEPDRVPRARRHHLRHRQRLCRRRGRQPDDLALSTSYGRYTSEASRRLWDEMVPPPTRKIACRLTVTYAGFTGESVLLEELHKRGFALPEVGSKPARWRWPAVRLASRADRPVADRGLAGGDAPHAAAECLRAHDHQRVRQRRVRASSIWQPGTRASSLRSRRCWRTSQLHVWVGVDAR